MRAGVRTAAAAVAAAALLAVAAPGAMAASPSLYGAGSGPLEPADRVHVIVTARGDGTAAKGRFTIIHQTPTGLFARLSGEVDCLHVGGGAATVTGTITSGFDGFGINPVGHRVSVGVDGASVWLDVSFLSEHAIAPFSSDPILPLTLDRGGFRIG